MAFTPGLITGVFQRPQTDGTIQNLLPDPSKVLGGIGEQQAGYVDVDNNGNWWKQSGTISYSTNPSATAVQELATAKNSFFTPQSFSIPSRTLPLSFTIPMECFLRWSRIPWEILLPLS
jgi:hypothetical protein